MLNFEQYDQENPAIWREFVRFAQLTKERGFLHYSAKGIFELIRWHTGVKGSDGFKVNNNFTADFARKMAQHYPAFQDFFRTRELKASRATA